MTSIDRSGTELTVREQPGAAVICPRCDASITEIVASTLRPAGSTVFGFGKRYVYACPACRAVLGVSHRKGFWMG